MCLRVFFGGDFCWLARFDCDCSACISKKTWPPEIIGLGRILPSLMVFFWTQWELGVHGIYVACAWVNFLPMWLQLPIISGVNIFSGMKIKCAWKLGILQLFHSVHYFTGQKGHFAIIFILHVCDAEEKLPRSRIEPASFRLKDGHAFNFAKGLSTLARAVITQASHRSPYYISIIKQIWPQVGPKLHFWIGLA